MLSFLLTAATGSYETPVALCPPCHEEEPATVLGFLVSLIKSAVSLLVIVFPLYKTFKAWESNRLHACRAMLAYWSAMTLLNALKDVTDELIGNYLNATLHHLIVACLKLAPLVLGPDTIYNLTVRSFFEQHEAEMDAMVLAGTEKAHELKERMEPALDRMKEQVAELKERMEPVMEKIEATVEPTIESIRESLRESVDTVKSTLGMETEASTADSTATAGQPTAELSAEEAMRKDEELTVEEDKHSKTGLRQRSARMESSSNSPTGVSAEAVSEIEQAKQRNVLVEKIVWGHGLSAKNEEYQRQLKEKEAVQDTVMADVHAVANQFNTTPAPAPATLTTAAAVPPAELTETYNRTATAPPLPPRPSPMTDAITITDSTTSATTTTTTTSNLTSSTYPTIVSSAPSTLTTSAAVPVTPTAVLDARGGVMAGGSKRVLLDTRSIPSVVETYAPDQQKEL